MPEDTEESTMKYIHVKVDEQLWKDLRMEGIQNGLTAGEAVTEAIEQWLTSKSASE